ncbi:MAG: hypothetical protein R3C20_24275 [Planctomycetaceae bacterium]
MTDSESTFLIKEYDSAQKLAYHVDDLRAKLTSFFLTMCGIAAAAVLFLMKGDASVDVALRPAVYVAYLLAAVAGVGALVVCIVARLRRAQIEHFRITCNIRRIFLGSDVNLWNAVELSDLTVPKPNRLSGSYFWVLIVISVSALFGALALPLYFCIGMEWWSDTIGNWLGGIAFWVLLIGLDQLYFAFARPTPRPEYTQATVDEMLSASE